jgi:hypothetical protein
MNQIDLLIAELEADLRLQKAMQAFEVNYGAGARNLQQPGSDGGLEEYSLPDRTEPEAAGEAPEDHSVG